jgi:hypothetical protein
MDPGADPFTSPRCNPDPGSITRPTLDLGTAARPTFDLGTAARPTLDFGAAASPRRYPGPSYDPGAVTRSCRDLDSGSTAGASPRSISVSVYVADEGIHEQVQTAVEQWLGTANVSIEAWE